MKKYYKIAEHVIAIKAEDSSPVWTMCPNYTPFESEASDSVVCSLEFVTHLEVPEAVLVHDVLEKGFPRLRISHFDGGWIVEMSPERDLPFVACLKASEGFESGMIEVFPGKEKATRFALDNAMMMLFALSTATLGTLEIHSSVTLWNGKGYAFLGKSGTGKSTHSRLWKENIPSCELLNDDNPIIRIIDGQARIYGSPWSGKTPCYKNLSAPLGAVVRISQSPENKIHRLSVIEAYASMFSSCSAFREIKDTADGLHATLAELVSKVPMYLLDCRPDAEAAHLCHSTVTGQ